MHAFLKSTLVALSLFVGLLPSMAAEEPLYVSLHLP
jgi:hypothetical protein